MTNDVVGPLANLDQAVPQIIYGNGPRQGPSLTGAVVGGILGVMFGRWLERRREGQQ